MSLEDSCFDMLYSLAGDIIHYSNSGYSPQRLIPLFDAMYNLATYTNLGDVMPGAEQDLLLLGIDSLVITPFLIRDDDSKATSLHILADVSKLHPRLANSINRVFVELTMDSKHYFLARDEDYFSNLTEVKKLMLPS